MENHFSRSALAVRLLHALGLGASVDAAGPSVEYYLAGQLVSSTEARKAVWDVLERTEGSSSLLLDQFSDLWVAAHFPGGEGMGAREILRHKVPEVEIFFV